MPVKVLVITLLVAVPLAAQDQSPSRQNPLPELMAEVTQVLSDAGVPFTAEQQRAITLMMEDRRQASEDLFGNLMDFSAGPTSGQEAERLQSAIAWIRDDFISRLRDYLTLEQVAAWNGRKAASEVAAATVVAGTGAPASRPPTQRRDAATRTQYVRINNNPFTAEAVDYRGNARGNTEVVQRGGTGGWHGNSQVLLKDDDLDARNAFAANKPVYQQRKVSVDVSGPVIPGRVTSTMSFSHNEAENVDTIHATLPDGIFALGITRPAVDQSVGTRIRYQVAEAHSLGFDVSYGTTSRKNQEAGGFNLPERASNSHGHNWDFDVQQFSAFSSTSVYESRFTVGTKDNATRPVTHAARIDVLDAFGRGGAQNTAEDGDRTYRFNNLYTRLGEKLTFKAGVDSTYRSNRSLSLENFGGTFTFSTPEAFVQGVPLIYRVSQGDPLLKMSQAEATAFAQHDLVLTPRLMLMLGARYEVQTNLSDYNNVGPRLGFAYSAGRETVIRGGAGVFYSRVALTHFARQRRLDGARQFEIIVDDPSFPDPFAAGRLRERRPSLRVIDPELQNARLASGMISVERTFPANLWVAVMYDYRREHARLRLRDLNAPFDTTAAVRQSCRPAQSTDTCVRPEPTRGQILSLESTGLMKAHNLRLNVRQRFSIFNLSAEYLLDLPRQDGSPVPQLPMDSYNPHADWSISRSPVHIFSSTVNARLPSGIFLTNRLSANSGEHYSITTGRDDNRDGAIIDRPPGVGRNSGNGPHYFNVDFNVSKAFFLGGAGEGGTRTNINVFANMLNAFNWVHYGLPSGVLTSPNFGRSTSAEQPREIEIGLRFQF